MSKKFILNFEDDKGQILFSVKLDKKEYDKVNREANSLGLTLEKYIRTKLEQQYMELEEDIRD